MSSYLLNTKLLASCSKCGRVVSATPYYTLWDKMTPSHINSSFLEQFCNFRLLYLPFFLLFISPNMDSILVRNLPSSRKNADVSIDTTVFEVRIWKNKNTHTCKLII